MNAFESYSVTIENMLIVTHAVPVQRVRPRVPQQLELDTIIGPEGEDVALVSASCFLNRDMRWSPSDEENLDFHQAVFQTYAKFGKESGIYVLGNFLERGTPLIFDRLMMKNAYAADFDISLAYNPATRSYGHYYSEILSSKGDTIIEISSAGEEPTASTPFKSGHEMAQFITRRCVHYFPMIGGKLGRMEIEFKEVKPLEAELLAGEFGFWEGLDILREEEFEEPYSVLVQPSVQVTVCSPEPIAGT